jgi:hypothetical protein
MKLETHTNHTKGYGDLDQHSLRLIYGNALLESKTFGCEYSMGREAVLLEQKWQRHIEDGTIDALAAEKPRAFLTCTICGNLCRNGGSSIGRPRCDPGEGGNHFLCKDCGQKEIPRIRQVLTAEREQVERELQARIAESSRQLHERQKPLVLGDKVIDSPVGPGEVTGFSEVGYPQVNHVAVARLKREDGRVFDPFGHYDKS